MAYQVYRRWSRISDWPLWAVLCFVSALFLLASLADAWISGDVWQ